MNAGKQERERAGVAFALVVTTFLAFALWPSVAQMIHAPSAQALFLAVEFVASVGAAMLVPALVGVGAAIFVSEFCAPRVRSVLAAVIECLVVVPGIVYAWGFSGTSASLPEASFVRHHVRTLVVIFGVSAPMVALLTLHILRSVPVRLRDAAVALGATHGEVFASVVLPIAGRAIVGACAFGLVRALGETTALLVVSNEDSPVRAFGSAIWGGELNVGYRASAHVALLTVTGLASVFAFRLVRRRVAMEET